MNSNYFKAVMPFAAAEGLKTDGSSGVIYGNYRGYNITVTPIQGGKTFQLSFSVKRGADMPSSAEMQQLTKLNKSLFTLAVTNKYRVDFNIKPAGSIANTVNKKLIPALSAAAAYMSAGGWQTCCQWCGETDTSGSYYIYNSPAVLCDSCFESAENQHTLNHRENEQKSENVIGGIVGVLLGSLLGALAIIVISRLGYFAAISGVIMGVCTLKGYEMLGGKFPKKGVLISCIIMVIMVFLSYQIDSAISLMSVDEYSDIGFFGLFRLLNYAMVTGGINWGSYLPSLILLYAFTALGAVPTVSGALKKQESLGKIYRMDSPEAAASATDIDIR